MRIFIVFLALLWAPFAVAQNAPIDADIQSRLTEIYISTTDLSNVTVQVENGVVTLSGEIANSELAKDAVGIADAQIGVIYIQDQIDRVLVADSNVVSALDSLKKDAADILQALPIIGLALLILLFFIWLGGVIARREKFWSRVATNPFLGDLLAQTMRIICIIIGLIIALNLLGAQAMIATILGGAGVVGIAIGFAVRDTLENYLASIMLSLRQPFRAGDHVLIGDRAGKVMRLTSRATILMTLDGNHLRIPNSTVFKAIILNYTTNPERRFQFELGIDAADDPVAAMQVGLDIMAASDFILSEPAPSAGISNVGDSNIVIKYLGWINQKNTSFGKARSLSIRGVKDALETQGFSLPEPIYRVKLDGVGGAALDLKPVGPSSEPKVISDLDQVFDVKPDQGIDEKVEQELADLDADNLLDDSKPTE
jgi:small-conductance mechanosensitive channel